MDKFNRAARAIKNSQTSNPHSKYVLDGRVYNSEKYSGPLALRKDVIKNLSHNEKVSATDIYNIERFLEGSMERVKASKITKAEREDIIERYNLTFDATANRWVGDEDEIYQQLCQQYLHAAKYKKYKGILYAMKYGDTPCVTYKES